MTSGPTFKVPFKRKRQQKTNYKKRLAYLKSKKSRFVVRVSNKLVKAQVVDYNITGDKAIVGVTSKDLVNLGWTSGLSNTSAVYLTALLLAKKAQAKKITEVIFDLGLYNYKAKSKIFAALKAIVDSGLDCPYDEKAFPNQDRIEGKVQGPFLKNNMEKEFVAVKEKILKM